MKYRDIFWILGLTLGVTVVSWTLMHQAHFMPESAAYEAVIVDRAFEGMLGVTIPIFALIVSTLIYILFRFSAKGSPEEGTKFYGSQKGLFETGWIVVSTLLTLGLAALGSKEFIALRGKDHAELNVQVKAAQFSWEFYYPEQNVFSHELILPKDQRVRLLLSSEDVVHCFWVPEFRVKQDIVPGKVIKLLFTPTKTGQYTLFCAELCGANHTQMTAPVRVIEKESFVESIQSEAW